MTILLFLGVPPLAASSSIHISKALTGGVAGVSHWRLNNVDKRLFVGLLVSGVSGGVVGALFLSSLPEHVLKPPVATYLLLTGAGILWGQKRQRANGKKREVPIIPLGAAGGFVNAVVGGGWGPVVTSTLLASGQNPRKTIGSVSFAEAFVATVITVTLLLKASTLVIDWNLTSRLIIGGVIAAPLAAMLTSHLPINALINAVGVLVVVLSAGMLVAAL